MTIWTIKEGEPLPIENCPGRQMRCGILSEMLAERGENVIWWTSDFFHQTKSRIASREQDISLSDNYRIHLLHARTTYTRNISIRRIIYCHELGQAFKRAAKFEKRPDVILCAYPLVEFAYEAVRFGKKNKIPVIVDIRDLWPDIFWEHYHSRVSGIVRFFAFGLRAKARYVMQSADTVIGTVSKSMEFAKSYGRKGYKDDGVYYLAYKERNYKKTREIEKFLKSLNIAPHEIVICYIGQINQRVDLVSIIESIKDSYRYRFIICGDGPEKEGVERKYSDCQNVNFTGFIGQEYLEAVMGMSAIGVIPIENTPDFVDTINNKAIEYMAGSLCVATKLKGLMRKVIEENELGFYFSNSTSFRKELDRITSDQEVLLRMKRNSRSYFEHNFKSEIVYGKLCELIERKAMQTIQSK